MSDGLRADPQEGTEQDARSAETAETRADADIIRTAIYQVVAPRRVGPQFAGICPRALEALDRLTARALGRSLADAHPSSGAVLVGDRRGRAGSGDDGNRRPGGGEPT